MRISLRLTLAALALAILAAHAWFTHSERRPERTPLGRSTSRSDLEQTLTVGRSRTAADPADTEAALGLADALLRKARVDGDAQHAIEAERVLEAALAAEPNDYSSRRLLAAVYLAQHRFRAAIDAATRAAQMRPADAWNYGALGDAYLEIGDYDRAFDAFDEMVRRRPDAASYARIAYAHEIQGRLRDALKYMRMASEATSAHDPESLAWHHAQLGHLHFQLGEIDTAAREFARAHFVFPDHPYAQAGLARVEAARGDRGAALARFRALLDRAASPELAAAVGDLMRVEQPAEAQRMYALAESLERQGWEHEAPQPAALARMLAERGLDADEAVRLAEAAARDRKDIFTMDALAWAYFRAGRFADAREASLSARRTGTADRRILYHAAAIEHALGNDAAARVLVGRALDGHPSFEMVASDEARALADLLGREG
jgi:tetratricopeptide (TPR) repeat protein